MDLRVREKAVKHLEDTIGVCLHVFMVSEHFLHR